LSSGAEKKKNRGAIAWGSYRDGPRREEREEVEEVPSGARIVQVEILRLVQIVDLAQQRNARNRVTDGWNRAFGQPTELAPFFSSHGCAMVGLV
jgi:hypothetical protein